MLKKKIYRDFLSVVCIMLAKFSNHLLPDWPVEAWHEAREAVEDLFCNIINWFELSKDFKENAAMTNNEKYRNRFSNEEIQNAVLLFNRFRKSYEFLKKKKLQVLLQ